jgi:hypothetical protein
MQVKVTRTNRQEAKSFLSARLITAGRSTLGGPAVAAAVVTVVDRQADKSSFEGKKGKDNSRAHVALHRNGTETRKDVGPFPIQM